MIEAKQEKQGAAQARTQLARDITSAARGIRSWREKASDAVRSALATIESFAVSAGVGGIKVDAQFRPGRANTGDIELDIEELVADLVPALRESKIALGIFVDEIQDLDPATLSGLLSTQHRAAQRDWPFYVFGAGLPVVPVVLAESRSYAERQFDYRYVDRLSEDEAREALTGPAERAGVEYSEEALTLLLDSAGGYPYFLQVYGDQAWRSAAMSPITGNDAESAVMLGRTDLDLSLFASRWERATPMQKQFMIAMAEDSGPSAIQSLVTRMGKSKPSDLSVFRDELIKKGLIYVPDRGIVAFTVPHMADFIRRNVRDV
jgi:hypothetical protein